MAGKKVTVQVGFEVLTNDITKAAKQMENIIRKSDARSQDKSRAEANVREVENYTKKINTLLQKPAMNQNDLNMLSGFEAKIRSLNDELKNIMSSVGVATTQEMKNIETQILSLNKAMEESAKDRNKRFKEQVSLRGEKTPFDYSDSDEGIKNLEANLERTKDIQTQFSEELERKRIVIDENARRRQQEAIAESIAEEEKQIANYETRYGKTAIAFENIEAEKLRIAAEYERAKEKFSNPEKRAAEETRIAERMANEEIQILRKKFDAIDKLKPHEKAKASKDAVGDQLGVQNFTQFKKALKDEVSLRETLMSQQSKKEIQAEILKGKENYDALKRELALVEQIAAAREKTAAKQGPANIAQFRTKEESNELKDLKTQDRKNKKDIENQTKKLKIIREVAAEIAKMEDAEISEYQVQVDALTEQLEAAMAKAKESFEGGKGSAAGGYAEATEELDGFKESLNSNSQAMDKAVTKQKALDDSFGQIANKIKQITGLVFLMRKAWQTLTKATDVVKGIDKEMANIAIVTKQSMDSIWDSFDRFNKAARELNTTTRQYLEGAKIFYQQGMSTAQVTEMVAATTKAAALSGVSFAAASETLTAAIRAYHMEASEASAVTDKFAAVGAASAANFQELSTSMEKVAASAYASGMEFDSLLGVLAKGVETTREAPEAKPIEGFSLIGCS